MVSWVSMGVQRSRSIRQWISCIRPSIVALQGIFLQNAVELQGPAAVCGRRQWEVRTARAVRFGVSLPGFVAKTCNETRLHCKAGVFTQSRRLSISDDTVQPLAGRHEVVRQGASRRRQGAKRRREGGSHEGAEPGEHGAE